MLLEGRRLVERAARWLLRNRRRPLDIAATVADFAPGAGALFDQIPVLLAPEEVEPLAHRRARAARRGRAGEAGHARGGAAHDVLHARHRGGGGGDRASTSRLVARVHFDLGYRLQLHWLRDRIVELPRDDRWRALSRAALRDDLYGLHRALTAEVLHARDGQGDAHEMVERVAGFKYCRGASPGHACGRPRGPCVRPNHAARGGSRGAQPSLGAL